jgi:Arc/MetJ family transcription regulator
MQKVLPQLWQQMHPDNGTLSDDVLVTVMRITGGNFRLMQRLLSQVERIVDINHLDSVTKEAVEIARESLIIGAT